MFEQSDEGGAQRPSEQSVGGPAGAAALLRMVAEMALGQDGEVAPDTASILALRKHPSRELVLRQFVSALQPGEVNPELWLRWMAGGEEPFQAPKLKRVKGKELNSGRTLERSSSRVLAAESAVEKARRELAEREAEFERALAFDKAVVQYCVSEHLASIVAPIFAMGPGWVIMRILSAYVGPAELAEETMMAGTPKRVAEIEAEVRAERARASERALRILDQWSGDVEFERDLRAAIMGVVKAFEARDEDAVKRGLRRRSAKDIRTSVQPDATVTKGEILEGFSTMPEE